MESNTLKQFRRIEEVVESLPDVYGPRTALQIWQENNFASITYHALCNAMQEGAVRLQAVGVKSGDRIILLGETRRIEWVIAFLAIVKAKATAVILDASIAHTDFQTLIPYSDARVILTTADFNDLIKTSVNLPILNYQQAFEPFPSSPLYVSEATMTVDGNSDIAGIFFTSGTTFQPKGVMLSHQGILHIAIQSVIISRSQKGEQILGILPLHHSFGLGALLMALFAGGTLTFVDKLQSESILNAMLRSHTTFLIGTPRLLEAFYKNILQAVKSKGILPQTVFKILCFVCRVARSIGINHLGRRLFKSVHAKFGGELKTIFSGASPLPDQVYKLLEVLGWTVMEGYGLTETSGAISCHRMDRRRAGTVGFPLDQTEVKISHPNVHGEGEICFRGPNVMLGYFRDPQGTQHMLREGWLHTGDLGFFDKDGFLKITGRIKELIVAKSGKKIMPDDVEQRYYGIPGILELAVLAIRPSDQPYDEVHAALVVDPKISPARDSEEVTDKIKQLLSYRARSIPSYMHIQRFHIVEELPKTTTLKVRRAVLKKHIEEKLSNNNKIKKFPASHLTQIKEMNVDEVAQRVMSILINQSDVFNNNKKTIQLSHSLQFDLGVDSLSRIEIAANLKREFNIHFDDQLFFNIDKVEDIVLLVKSSLKDSSSTFSEKKSLKEALIIPKMMPLSNKLFFGWFKLASRLVWRFEVVGMKNLPSGKPFILCSNHVTNLDLLWVASCLKEQDRLRLCCFGKEEIFKKFFFNRIARICHAIPVARFGDISLALQAGESALQSGRHLLINPEGTRSFDGKIGPFRKGAAHLALQTGCPLIPVKIIGGIDIFPPHLKLPRFFNWRHLCRFKLKIIFGEPFQVSSGEQDETVLTDVLRNRVEQLGIAHNVN